MGSGVRVPDRPPLTIGSMHEKNSLPHFAELDGLRGLAALAVFVYHFFNLTPHAPIFQFASLGYLGVQVFFVLSGFLITSLLLIDRREPSMIRNFYWKRILRIWPALLLYLCAAFTLAGASSQYVLLSILFIANFEGLFGKTFQFGPTWTLAIEEQFYLLWPQVIRRFKVNTIFLMSGGIYALSVGLRTLVPIFRHDAIAMPYTPYQCDGLALGSMLACQWFAQNRLKTPARRLARFFNGPVSLLLWCGLLIVDVAIRRSNLNVSIQMTLATFFAYRLMALIVLKRDYRLQWLGWNPLVFLGSISYGFYLYHGIVLGYVCNWVSAPALRFAVSLSLALAVSYASLRFVEMPIRRLGRRKSHRIIHLQDGGGGVLMGDYKITYINYPFDMNILGVSFESLTARQLQRSYAESVEGARAICLPC